MIKQLTNFVLYFFLLISLNSCSTISETIDLAGIVDKTEDLFFGKEEETKDSNTENTDVNEVELSDEDIPDISEIPIEQPEFADLEKDFFDGEDSMPQKSQRDLEIDTEEKVIKNASLDADEANNIIIISKIAENVRMRVKKLLLNSNPPTKNDGKKISYEKEIADNNFNNYSDEDKVAVFYFPNNSVIPDAKAESVIIEIVKIYSNNLLILEGHASSTGGSSPEGKKINMKISFSRAEAIKNMLISKGFPEENINIIGKGDLKPEVEPNGNIIESKNRRVEVFLVSK